MIFDNFIWRYTFYAAAEKERALCPLKSASPIFPDEVIQSLARTLLPAIRKYFDSEEGQKEFAEWKAKRDKKTVKRRKLRG